MTKKSKSVTPVRPDDTAEARAFLLDKPARDSSTKPKRSILGLPHSKAVLGADGVVRLTEGPAGYRHYESKPKPEQGEERGRNRVNMSTLAKFMKASFEEARRKDPYGHIDDIADRAWENASTVIAKHMRKLFADELRVLGEIDGANALAAPE